MRSSKRAAGVAVLAVACVLTPLAGSQAQVVGASPPSAESVVAAGLKAARTHGKVVLIEFGASWCTWCRNFDAFVHAPDVGQIVADNYEVVNLTVQERDEKKALENPGAAEKMKEWGGANSGLPFYVFLDVTGRKVGDSNAMPDGSNIGFPGTPQELQVFVALLQKTAPRMSHEDRTKIVDYLNKGLEK